MTTVKPARKRTPKKTGVVVKKEATQVTIPAEPTPAPEAPPEVKEAPTPLIVETAPPVEEQQAEAR